MVSWVRHLRHPASPTSFKALLLILISHAAGALVGLAVLSLVIAKSGDRFGPQIGGARTRTLALIATLAERVRPSRAPG